MSHLKAYYLNQECQSFPALKLQPFEDQSVQELIPAIFHDLSSILVIIEISDSIRLTGSYFPPIPISKIAKSKFSSAKKF